jgi:hypothetical protein
VEGLKERVANLPRAAGVLADLWTCYVSVTSTAVHLVLCCACSGDGRGNAFCCSVRTAPTCVPRLWESDSIRLCWWVRALICILYWSGTPYTYKSGRWFLHLKPANV